MNYLNALQFVVLVLSIDGTGEISWLLSIAGFESLNRGVGVGFLLATFALLASATPFGSTDCKEAVATGLDFGNFVFRLDCSQDNGGGAC